MFTTSPLFRCLSSFQIYKQRFDALPKKTRLILLVTAGSGVSFFLGLCLISILGAPKTFRKATSVVGKKALTSIVAENYSGPDSKSIYKSARALDVDGKFSIIDFNNPALCGNAGGQNACLYVAYMSSGKNLLSLYLNPTVIKNRPLFEVSDQQKDGFPCLKITQVNDADVPITEAVQVYDYCYSAGTGVFIRIVDGLERPVLAPSPTPAKTPQLPKKKGSSSTPNSTPSPTPVVSPS
jgi:hypothetical protein